MKRVIILVAFVSLLSAEQFSKSLTTVGWHNVGVPIADINVTTNTFNDNISVVWQWDSSAQDWKFYSKNTTLLAEVEKLHIPIITTLQKGDAIWVKNSALTSINFTDVCTEPNLSSLLASPKVYNYTDLDVNYTMTMTQYGSNSIKLLSNQISSDSSFIPEFSDSQEYIFTWTDKGYESNHLTYNYTLYQGKYASTHDVTIQIDKGKEFIYLDCLNKQIKIKNYYLFTITTSNENESNTKYFVVTNLDERVEVPKYYYHTLLSEFDTKYDSLPIVVDTDTPSDIVSQIFQDLGF